MNYRRRAAMVKVAATTNELVAAFAKAALVLAVVDPATTLEPAEKHGHHGS